MSNFHTVCYGMFPMCHVSNKMQKSQFNAKYDCPHEDAVIFSLLLVRNIKLLVLQCTSLETYFYLGFSKQSDDKDAFGMSGSHFSLS